MGVISATAWRRSQAGTVEVAVAPEPQPGLSHETVADPAQFELAEPGRGRVATKPSQIPWRGWRDVLWRTWREIAADRLSVVAGSVTYYSLLAIFPALGAFVSLYGLFADVGVVQTQLTQLSRILPSQAVDLLGEQMIRLATREDTGLSLALIISLVLSIWSASAGMRALFDGLNTAYDEIETRSFVKRTALTYGFTIALLIAIALGSAVLVLTPRVLGAFDIQAEAFGILLGPVLLLVVAAAFAVVYRYGPSRAPAKWRWLTAGSLLAAALWMGGSAGFSWYLGNVANLDVTYGSLGTVIGFMIWLWFSVMVILIGAELNSEIEHQTALDSTTGAPQPMGERGAVMADTVGLGFGGLRKSLGALRTAARARLSRTRPPAPPAARPGPPRSTA